MTCNVSEYRLGNLTFSIEQEKLQTLYIFIINIIIVQVNGLDLFWALLLIPRKSICFWQGSDVVGFGLCASGE